MRKWKSLMLLGISAVMLGGCSMKFSAEEDAVYVNKKGQVLGAIVESFDKDYYDADELQGMLEQDVVEYNGENGKNSIEVDSFKVSGGQVKVIMNYADWADYAHFNDGQFFAGKLADIQGKNYGANVTFTGRDGSETLTLDQIEGDYYVILLEEKIVVQTAGKIAYVSNNVSIEGEKLARVNEDATGLAYIIYEK